MRNDCDVARFVKEPDLLIELCREVIDQIEADSDDPASQIKEAQLREIAKAVEKLEKMGVAVPDALRAEKTRLAAELGSKAVASGVLNLLFDGFGDILKGLKSRLNRSGPPTPSGAKGGKRSRSPKTDKKVLRENIIRALRTFGGRAKVTAVIEEMERQLTGKLLPGDLEWRATTNEYAWQNNAKWERYQMTQDGTLRSDSPRGYWELDEDHR